MKNNYKHTYETLYKIYKKYQKRYKGNPDSEQMCCMWSTYNPPDIIEGTKPFRDIEHAFNISIDNDDALDLYDMHLDEAAKRIIEIRKRNVNVQSERRDMAEYGEWNRKGATLSDVTAQKEYGVSRDFIVRGIQAGRLEYREGVVWGNPYLRVLRRQLEQYIAVELGSDRLTSSKSQAELRKIKKEIAGMEKRMRELQVRRTEIEKQMRE